MRITETAKRLSAETALSSDQAQMMIDRFGLGAYDAVRCWIATGTYPRAIAEMYGEAYEMSFAGQREIRLRRFDEAIDASRALGVFGLVTRFTLRRARGLAARAMRFPHPEPVVRDGELVGVYPGPRS